MDEQLYNSSVLMHIQSTLSQYPILSEKIENEMYNRLIQDEHISAASFSRDVRSFALFTQKREGLNDPFGQEAPQTWEERLLRVRSTLIRQKFSMFYTLDDFERTLTKIIQNSPNRVQTGTMWHNIHNAALESIFDQALKIEHMPAGGQQKYRANLISAKVTLINRLITNRTDYIRIAKDVFSVHDLLEIYRHRIGRGPIGSRSAELLLSNRILHSSPDADIRNAVGDIDFMFIGADEFYEFLMINNLLDLRDEKYKDESAWREDYPSIQESFAKGEFSAEVQEGLRGVILTYAGKPLIVRSSSLLENNAAHPFNGMYHSVYLPNQGTPEENLNALEDAIRKVYASGFDPNALSYRLKNGLIDGTEQMAILIERVYGHHCGPYFFADVSGVGSSVSPYKWHAGSQKDDGFLRLSAGFGGHSYHRTGDDFTHIVELSDPNRRHTTFTENENQHAQKYMIVLNMKTNSSELVDVQDVLNAAYPPLYLVAQKENADGLSALRRGEDTDVFRVTCDELIRKTNFTRLLRDILQTLERAYKQPVLIEFSAMIDVSTSCNPNFTIQIHNCRPTYIPEHMRSRPIVLTAPAKRELFSSDLFTGDGIVSNISYVVFVEHEAYRKLYGKNKAEFCQLLRDINRKLAGENFIFIADSRWGTSENHGIPVTYLDVSNAKAIVELSGFHDRCISDPFCGTQFYQSLVESGIYPIITNADKTEYIDRSFFTDSPDQAADWVDIPAGVQNCVKILSTRDWYGSRSLTIEMNSGTGITRAYFI